jgi:transposase-like protein
MKSWHVPAKYPQEVRERAVRVVAGSVAQGDYPSDFVAIRNIAGQLGIGIPETLRKWVLGLRSMAAPGRVRRQRRSLRSES